MKRVLTFGFIVLGFIVIASVVFLLFISDSSSVDQNVLDLVDTDVNNQMDINFPIDKNTEESIDENIPIDDSIIDCGQDFSCFLNNILTCTPNVIYTQIDTINYPENGTKNNFTIKYTSLGFNEFNECEVILSLEDQRYSFTDNKKQEYLDSNYTDAGVLEVEESLNIYNNHLISKTGICKLDVSTYSKNISSLDFLNSIMQNIQNCSGDLFVISEDPTKAPFFIYIN